ncbi:MAG TPA: hypothetical protein VEB22_08270, partial [Phycisphaerales bacterium]|nr:hypothetical protein [Phycisphaerales bacterium]
LVGWFSCGLLCPVGLVLSLVGLRKQPRGLAVAGVILGLLGTVWGVIAWVFIGLAGLISCGGVMCGGIAPHVVTNAHMAMLEDDIERFRRTNGRLPDSLTEAGRRGHRSTRDGWGRPLRMELNADGTFTIVSDGPDGVPQTGDDIRRDGGAGSSTL